MSRKSKALVVAGGQWQVPIIQYLLDNNYEVSVADPYATSPGVLIANRHIKSDARDVSGILGQLQGEHFDLVTTDQSDISVETVTALSNHFGLNGNNIDAVKKFTNKYLSRQYAKEQNLPTPQFHKAGSIAEVVQIVRAFDGAMILKPVDSQSSRGIYKIDVSNIDKLEELAALTFKESREDYILVEEFFEGIELTVEGICSSGKHKTLAISQKKHFRTGIASDLIYPAELPTAIEEEVVRNNDRYVENSGLNFGITHAEYLYNQATGKIALVEIACRGGGSLISSHIAKWVSGVDIYSIFIDNLKGKATDIKQLQPLKRPAILHFFEFSNGRVDDIQGLDAIAAMQGVVMIKMDFKKGDHIKAANDDRSRQGFVIIVAETKQELAEKLQQVNNTLKVSISSVQ